MSVLLSLELVPTNWRLPEFERHAFYVRLGFGPFHLSVIW